MESKLKESEKSEQINERIEQIVRSLKIPRSSVFFIENYHGQTQSVTIDYYSLKLLYDCLKQSAEFIPHN